MNLQIDSMLVARQVNVLWSCKQPSLLPLLENVWSVLRRMRLQGTDVVVEHVYREFNRAADRLASHAVSSRTISEWVSGAAIPDLE